MAGAWLRPKLGPDPGAGAGPGGCCRPSAPAGEAPLVQGPPSSAACELPDEDGAVGGREEAAAGGGEAAEVDSVIMAGVVLRLAGWAAQQP